MASVNWKKMTSAEVSGMYLHLDQNARLTHEHSNKDIQKELTPKNYIIGANSFKGAVNRMKERTKTVDAVQPPLRVKKDRVVACMLEYVCPKEIADAGRADEFFRAMYEECCAYFGKENVHASFIHKDEVHTYIDSQKHETRESLQHAHTLVSAYTAEKGINGKAFETRARLKEFNEHINRMCAERFGIEYNTHDTPAHKSVEELKAESRELAAIQKAEEATRTAKIAVKETRQRQDELKSLTEILSAVKNVSPDLLYPPEAERFTKGIGSKKKEYVTVPKELWEKRSSICFDAQTIQSRAGAVLMAIEQWKKSASGKYEKELTEAYKALIADRDKLAWQLRDAETANEAYKRGYREANAIFGRVLDKLDDTTFERVNWAIKQVDRELAKESGEER